MKTLRRHGSGLGIGIAWILCLGVMLGGLSLARMLPEAHARALAHATLCLPGEDGAPAGQAQHQHGGGCLMCPAPAGAPSVADAPAAVSAPALARAPTLLTFAATSAPRADDPVRGFAQARAPPVL